MEKVTLNRDFTLERGSKSLSLPDPDPAMSANEVRKFYSRQYPELLNCSTAGPLYEGDMAKYTFRVSVGVKG